MPLCLASMEAEEELGGAGRGLVAGAGSGRSLRWGLHPPAWRPGKGLLRELLPKEEPPLGACCPKWGQGEKSSVST